MMNERILNLLSLCMQAKTKGIDCFFNYSPHVNKFEINVHLNGWHDHEDPNYTFVIRENGLLYENELGIDYAEPFLKGLTL